MNKKLEQAIKEIQDNNHYRNFGSPNACKCPDCGADLEVCENIADEYYKFYLKFIKHNT